MNTRRLSVLAGPVLIAVSFLLPAMPARAATKTAIAAEIRPEIELLAGVLAQTSWDERQGPKGEGNEYYRALKAYLAPFREHEAIKLAEKLSSSFNSDAPPAFMLYLTPLPNLDLKYEYSDYLGGRARGRDNLERFRLALKDLADKSRFTEFVARWQPKYAEWTGAVQFDGDRVTRWLETFYGEGGHEFHFVLAPALFPGGGYGPTINTPDGRSITYQIIRENGTSTGEPEFPTGTQLERLAAHEWGHGYVNPVIERAVTNSDWQPLYAPVAPAMRKQGYSTPTVFLYEQVLRAAVVLFVEETRGKDAAEQEIAYNLDRGFYMTRPAVAMLREYQQHRDQYPDFRSFAPTLLERLKAVQAPPDYHPMDGGTLSPVAYIAAGGAVLAAAGSGVLLLRRRRKKDSARVVA